MRCSSMANSLQLSGAEPPILALPEVCFVLADHLARCGPGRMIAHSKGYSKRTLPGVVMRRSSGSVTVMTPNATARPMPIRA